MRQAQSAPDRQGPSRYWGVRFRQSAILLVMTRVDVVYRKYDGSLHWHFPAQRLGEDAHGIWVGLPAGTRAQRGYEPPELWPDAAAMLFPRNAWWTASFNAAPHRTQIYCDITTVPQWNGDEVTMVDLDLDVVLRRTGALYVDDEDEFTEHQTRYGYSDDVIASAQSSCDWPFEQVQSGQEPFTTGYKSWLDLMTGEPTTGAGS